MLFLTFGVFFKVINLTIFTVLSVFFLWGPGFLFFENFRNRFGWSNFHALVVIPVASAFFAYGTFWAYFASRWLGIVGSCFLMLGTTWLIGRRIRAGEKFRFLKTPLVLTVLCCLFYNGLILSRRPLDAGPKAAANITNGSGWELPFDNLLPLIFAERLFDGSDPRDLGASWRSSDRPPLEAGFWLMEMPLFSAMDLNYSGYHSATCVLQALWIFAILLIGKVTGENRARLFFIFTFLLFSGFVFLNTVYAWPKMLAASYFIFALMILLFRSPTKSEFVLAGSSLAFSLLSHGGSAFALVVLLPWWFFSKAFFKWKPILYTIGPLVLLLLPWISYQKCYDPPGDRLLKMHLAGVDEIDARPLVKSLGESYSTISWTQVWETRRSNLRRQWDAVSIRAWLKLDGAALRTGQFFSLFHTLGVLNLGLLFILFGRGKRIYRKLLQFSVVMLAIWMLAMFKPGAAVLHQGSYVPVLLLFYCAAATLHAVLRKLVVVFWVPHVIVFFLVWVQLAFQQYAPGGWIWLLVSLVSGIAFLRVCAFKTLPLGDG